MNLNTLTKAGLLSLGGYILWRSISDLNTGDYSGKCVLITGGSRGLGLVLARQLVQQGAKLMLAARSQEELIQAGKELQELTRDIYIYPADLRDPQQVIEMVDETLKIFGRIDVVIHNAGLIDVGPIEAMNEEDFESEMDIHFWTSYYLAQQIVPVMKKQGGGQIINIASFGGLVSVPHLLPYCSSKFALVGFSEGLGIELDRYKIKVTTVCPGLMRTGSVYQAMFRGEPELEKTWFTLAASLPVVSMSAERAARQILAASSRGQALVILSLPAKIAARVHSLFPNLWSQGMKLINRFLPNRIESSESFPGHILEDKLPESVKILTRKAAMKNNELAA